MGRRALASYLGVNALFGVPFAGLLLLLVGAANLPVGTALLCGLVAQVIVAIIAWPYFSSIDDILSRFGHGFSQAQTDRLLVPADMVRIIDRQREDIEDERVRLLGQASTADAVLEALNDPVVVIDERRRVMRINARGRQMFGDPGPGSDLALVLRQPSLLSLVDGALTGGSVADDVVEFALPGPPPGHWQARVIVFPPGQGDNARAIITLHDITSLRRAEQMRADFVANASHELRTPLSSLLGFIETLRGPARDDVAARERFLAIMSEQAARMARLVADLLSLSQIELKEHTAPQGEVDLAALARVVAGTLEPQARAKGVKIEFVQAAEAKLVVPGDADQLSQVVQNLLDNAIKYSPDGGRVWVSCATSGQQASLSIRDEGEGIPREHLPRLTERFYRVDSARSRALGGTGLGLAIVKHIISRHRGHLAIVSEPGKGATFTIQLPLGAAG